MLEVQHKGSPFVWSRKRLMFKLNSEEEEALEIKLWTFIVYWSSPENFRRKLIYGFTAVKPLTAWIMKSYVLLWKRRLCFIQHLIVLRCNLFGGQEATVRPEYGETNWLPVGEGVRDQGAFYLPICLICMKNTIRKAELDSEEGGVNIYRIWIT